MCTVMWFEGGIILFVIFHTANGAWDPLFGTNDNRNDPSIDITPIAPTLFYGNGGFWDANKNLLYFVDSILGIAYRYDPATGEYNYVFVAFGIATIVPVKGRDNLFLASAGLSGLVFEWDGVSSHISSTEEVFNVESMDETGFRFNGGRADKNGVYFTGTFGKIILNIIGVEAIDPGKAALYRYRDNSGTCELTKVLSDATAIIGLDWSPDNTIMYFIDIATRSIEAFDYDLETATMSNRRTVFNISENGFTDTANHLVLPISVAVDDQGNLWVTIYGVGQVVKISPDGQLLQQIHIPTLIPSVLFWGGEDLSTLYVTSAPILLKPLESISNLRSGSLFAIEGTGSRGVQGRSYEANYCPS